MVPEFDESANEEVCQLVELAIKSENAVGVVGGAVSEFISCSPPQPAAASGSDVRPAAQTYPSTRAGGQDDVSSEQTPSNYRRCGIARKG